MLHALSAVACGEGWLYAAAQPPLRHPYKRIILLPLLYQQVLAIEQM